MRMAKFYGGTFFVVASALPMIAFSQANVSPPRTGSPVIPGGAAIPGGQAVPIADPDGPTPDAVPGLELIEPGRRPVASPPAGGETRVPRGEVVERASPREVTRDTPPLAPTDETDFVLKQLLTIADRAAEHHFAITKDLLARTEGERFDQGFVSMQLADRARVLAQLRAMKEIGSPPFREIIQTAEGLTQGHLASAEELSARSNKR